jgi:hypothetical protein
MIFHTCIYCILILTPSNALSFPCSPQPPTFQQLSVGFFMPSSYIDTMCFNIIHPPHYSLFFSPLSLSSQSLTITVMFYVHVYVSVHIF